jgi:hypothetical protein
VGNNWSWNPPESPNELVTDKVLHRH